MKPEITGPGGGASVPSHTPQSEDPAANVIRAQIDSLYDHPDGSDEAHDQIQTTDSAPIADVHGTYAHTHAAHPLPEAEQWKAYHSAWQNYYQQYYAQYYAQQQGHAQPGYFSQQPTETPADASPEPDTLTKDSALRELRNQLRDKVGKSAKKVKKSRHFKPLIAAITAVLVFAFFQYNQIVTGAVYAYISPGAISPQNIVIDPSNNAAVSDEPLLIIPKINVEVPVLYDVGVDYDSQMDAMAKGVAHFPIPGANSHPGEIGNTVLSGHSSNDLFDKGDYKFIFAQLDRLKKGDTIYANYRGVRYTYIVTGSEVVKPTQVNKLVYETDKPVMTLITCTPLGTALNRLLVSAEQVSPDPADAKAAPASTDSNEDAVIPGNGETVFEKLYKMIFG